MRQSAFDTKRSTELGLKELVVDVIAVKDDLESLLKELQLQLKELEMKKISAGVMSIE